MALVVETGAVVSGANSYVSIADAGTYHEARGNTAWGAAYEEVQEEALLRAMDWLEAQPFAGIPVSGPVGVTACQPLQWPRIGVVLDGYAFPENAVPAGIVKALCEAALIELGSPGALAPALERGGAVVRQKVDVIETEYAAGAPSETVYTALRQALRGLVRGGNSVELVRV